MIISVHPLPVGNALKLRLSPPAGAVFWRILRKESDDFTGPDDASAFIAYQGTDLTVLDHQFLRNGETAHYRPYYKVGDDFVPGETASGTPDATYDDLTQDAFDVLMDRLEAGLQVEVDRGTLKVDHGAVQVMSAPPPIDNNLRFPVVTLHLENDSSDERAIGEDFDGIGEDHASGDLVEGAGWIERVRISVVGWSLNPDERNDLRKALRRIVVANLEVFASHGMDQVTFEQSNNEMLGEQQGANLYLSEGTFSCIAPVTVASRRARETLQDISIGSNFDVQNPHGDCGCHG